MMHLQFEFTLCIEDLRKREKVARFSQSISMPWFGVFSPIMVADAEIRLNLSPFPLLHTLFTMVVIHF
jgi:hypothetical protein